MRPSACRSLATLFAGLVVLLGIAETAGAAVWHLRPEATRISQGWSSAPDAAQPLHEAIGEPVLQPAVPGLLDPYIWTDGGNDLAELFTGRRTLRPGENVLGATLWVYADPSNGRTLDFRLRAGQSQNLAVATIAAGAPSGWYSVRYTGSLAQTQLDDLRFRLAAGSGGGSSAGATRVRAAYVEVETDLPPPPPTITTAPASPGSSKSPAWSFTGEDASGFECRLARGATVVADWAACASPRSYDLSGQPDEGYAFAVRSRDLAGLRSTETTSTYVLDTTPPPAPAFTSTPSSPSQAATPSWSFSAEAGAITECRLDRDGSEAIAWASCTSPRGFDLSARSDGTYRLRVRARDAAGNVSPEATGDYVLDRTPPAAPAVTGGPSGSTNDALPSFSFTAEAGAALACRLERGSTVVSGWAPCTSPRAYDLAAEPDGSYVLRVRATDAAGNASGDGTRSFTLDRTPPAAPSITDAPAMLSNDDTPTYAFTGESGATFECRLERGVLTVQDWTACASPRTFDLRAEPDAVYTFRVRAVDAAGNPGAVTSRTSTLDRAAPAAPTITSAPADPTAASSATVEFSGEAEATYACRLERSGTLVSDWSSCTSPRAYDLSSELDGTYAIAVRATDAAGNTGGAATATFTVDRLAPAAPAITGGPAAMTNDAQPAWSFTVDEGAPSCRLERGTTLISDWAPCASPRTYDLSSAPDGSYTFRVRTTDAAGNASTASSSATTLDRAIPPAPVFTDGPPAASSDATPTWSFTAEAGAATACRLVRNGTEVAAWAACTSPDTRDLTASPDGTYTLEVRATDSAGNTGAAASRSFRLDRAAPAAPSITGAPAADSADDTPTYAFTAEPGASLTCRLDDTSSAPVADWAPCTSPATYDLTDPRPDGTYTFRVRATDAAGNISDEATRTYTLDRIAPADPTITSAPPTRTSNPNASWSFGVSGAAALSCRLERDGALVADWATCTSPKTYDLSADADGDYTFSVRAEDGAFNASRAATSTFTLDRSVPEAPTITSGPPARSNDATPAWAFTGEAGARFECRIERSGGDPAAWRACASPDAPDLSAESDGTWTFSVRAIDDLGNVGAAAAASFDLDRADPAAPVFTAAPTGPSQDPQPEWAFTAEADATTACRLERDGDVVADWAACTSPRSFDLSGSPDGTYVLRVRATDPAGNTGPSDARSYELDRTAPAAPTIVAAPASPSRDDAPRWAFAADAGTTTECRLNRDGAEVSAWATCTSPRQYDLSAADDGTYAFAVRATDAAGNVGAARTASYRLDRMAPAAPVIDSTPPALSTDDTPRWTFAHEAGATAECRLDRGATQVRAWGPCASAYEPGLTAEPDGDYVFSVRASDAAGNVGAAATSSYTLDRTPPDAPVIADGPPADSADATPEWSFAVPADTTASCRLVRDGVTISPLAPCTSPRGFDLAAEPDGTYDFTVIAVDAAGNAGAEATASFRLDRVAPAAPVLTAGPPALSADDTPTWSFTGEAGASFRCRVDRGTMEVTSWRSCESPATSDLSTEPDGTYTFYVRAVDAAGNASTPTDGSYALDRQAPPAPDITSGPPASSTDTTPAWTFTAEADTATSCRLERGATVLADWAACASPAPFDLGAELDGTYTFRVRATDAAGNAGAAASRSFALDRTPPTAPTIVSAPPDRTNDPYPTWEFESETGATFQCRVERSTGIVSDWEPCARPYTYTLVDDPDDGYTFRVRAVDPAGNVGDAAGDAFVLDRVGPDAPAFTSGPPAATNDATTTFAWTAETGSASECRLEREGVVVSDWGTCASPATRDLSAEEDGAWSFAVRATDAAGNTGSSGVRLWTLDRVAPGTPAIDSAPAAISQDDTPTWSFTAAGADGTECRVERGGSPVVGWAPCASPHTVDLTGEPDGLHELGVRAVDAAGNRSAAATSSYALDRTAPAAPAFTGGPSGPTNDATPEWSFTTEDGARTDCRLEREGTEVAAWAQCTSPYGPDLTSRADGSYTVQVRATDLAGNTGAVASRTAELDRVAPAAPDVWGGPPAASTDDTPSWTFDAETGASVSCRLLRGTTVVTGPAACTSPISYDLRAAPDGTYTFEARATDAAGNAGEATTASYALDRSVPDAPTFTATPPAEGTGTSPEWSFRTPDGTTAECRVRHDDAVLAGWAACPSPRTADLSGRPDGTFHLDVRTINAAGTPSGPTTGTYRLDRVAPAAPVITDGPPRASSRTEPEWSFTAETGAATACRLERGTTVVSGWASCTSPRRFDLAGEPDGLYAFRVRATDAAGNTGTDASAQFTLDRTLPPAPTLTEKPATPTASRDLRWAFTGNGGVFECRFSRGGTPLADWAGCTSPYTASLAGEADATFTFEVRERSEAGNVGAVTRQDVVLDTAGPGAPVLTGDPGAVGRSSMPRWSFTAEAGATTHCRLELGDAAVRPWAVCASPREFGLAGEPDGTYRFSVRATDAAGNEGPVTSHQHVLDRIAPAAPVLTGPGPVGADRAPSWTIAAEPAAALECRVDRDGVALRSWAPCASPFVLDLASAPDGRYAVVVRGTDVAGNVGAEALGAYELDTTAGATAITAGPGATGRDRRPSWAFSGTDAGATLECRLERADLVLLDWRTCATTFAADLSGQPDGLFRFAVRATDGSGNATAPAVAEYLLDTAAPTAPRMEREPESPGTDRSPSWRFSGQAGATFACRVERVGEGAVQDWAPCASPFAANLLRQSPGEFRLLVRARDAAGNGSTSTTGRYVLEAPPAEPAPPPAAPPAPPASDAPAAAPIAPSPKPLAPSAPETAPPAAPDRTDESRAERPAAARTERRLERLRERARRATPPPERTVPPRRAERDGAGSAIAAAPKAVAKAVGKAVGTAGKAVGKAVTRAANVVVEHPDKSAFPVSLLLLVLAFFGVQGRIDRSDPKLALAPVRADPDLEFPIEPRPQP